VMDDLNAKVKMNFERVMGRQGCGLQNDNGERLVDWCSFNNMIIGGTLFLHRNIPNLDIPKGEGSKPNRPCHV